MEVIGLLGTNSKTTFSGGGGEGSHAPSKNNNDHDSHYLVDDF